jgi:threonine dehydrogenase-like Zn-dependent dehydrogenase
LVPKHPVHYEVGRRRRHAGAAQTVQSKKLDQKRLITHGFKLDRILDAYDTFSRAANTRAVKVIIEA